MYTVKAGDTLGNIAERFGTTFRVIESLNPRVRWRHLRIGQVINVPAFAPTPPSGTYLFADEFDGPAGTPPDLSKWAYDIGGDGWGNNELETYTSNSANCFQDGNSSLIIRAIRTGAGYTSARIKTLGKFSHYGGAWEARLRVPLVAGIWPAWWCMGTSPSQWPESGEVDMLEAYGANAFMESSVHLPDGSGGMQSMTGQKGIRYADCPVDTNWHVYRMAWDPPRGMFAFSMDGKPHLTVSSVDKVNWCYSSENPFYCLLNLAIGGVGGGAPESGFASADFAIDYVRVW